VAYLNISQLYQQNNIIQVFFSKLDSTYRVPKAVKHVCRTADRFSLCANDFVDEIACLAWFWRHTRARLRFIYGVIILPYLTKYIVFYGAYCLPLLIMISHLRLFMNYNLNVRLLNMIIVVYIQHNSTRVRRRSHFRITNKSRKNNLTT
jgi:hypothetical protein